MYSLKFQQYTAYFLYNLFPNFPYNLYSKEFSFTLKHYVNQIRQLCICKDHLYIG